MDAYQAYRDAGWESVFPLPPGAKHPPPPGLTGREAVSPGEDDYAEWAKTKADSNIGIRCPDGVVGLDVDHYGNKRGGDTLSDLAKQHGPLPATWRSSSRDDGISGIRLYRVPAGTVLRDGLSGIDMIQAHHRYFAAPPSRHPDGPTYEWYNEATGDSGGIPRVGDLPFLPASYVDALKESAVVLVRHQSGTDNEIISAMPDGDPCEHVQLAAGKAIPVGARHDSFRDATLAVIRAGRRGCPGVEQTLRFLREVFTTSVASDGSRSARDASQEWQRMVAGACDLVLDEPQGSRCGATRSTGETGRQVVLTPASNIKITPVSWLWDQRIAAGTLSILAGPEGLGKSTVAYWIAARLTKGELPGQHRGTPASVLIAATEDSWEHTIVPRLMAADADLAKVYRVEVQSSVESPIVV